ncbi:MAG: hypothetical protein HYS34_05655 [Acidobacteria bacterium]|nr:hypothetical protein [Acidobacteriota bacterium]
MTAPVEFHPRLVEEAVWAAIRGRRDAGVFHRQREGGYDEPDPEARDRAFGRLHSAWFERLGLARPVTLALREQSGAIAAARRVLLAPATSEGGEGAELFVEAPGRFTIVVTLRPGTLADPGAALALLRCELLHVSDMLDPAFEYEPRLPRQALGPAHDRRLLDRYRALWNCSVDGRLVRRGHLGPGARAARLREFTAAFACLGGEAEACFERIFSGPRPSHPGLLALAADPEAGFGMRPSGHAGTGRCPLCGFPTPDLEPRPDPFPAGVVEDIVSEFPAWNPRSGICPQCADLYSARAVAAAAAR